ITRANYDAALTMVSFDGDPAQSRLLRKSLPLWDGGIVHKGGDATFLTGQDAARAVAIREWVCAERELRFGEPCGTAVSGVVFVRGPLGPEPVFDLDAWRPGSDLLLATLGPDLVVTGETNLTA